LDIGPWTLDLAHCSLHIAPCTLLLAHCSLDIAPCTLHLHRWACRPLVDWLAGATVFGAVLHAAQVSRCGTLFFCSIVPLSLVSLSSAQQTIPGRPEISQGERTPRTHDPEMPPDRIKPPLNCRITAASWAHGCPVRPHQGCHQGCPLTDRGRVTHGRERRRGWSPSIGCACFSR
jgi:hypothetical protein